MFGFRIAMLRRQRGLSQAELARRLHISASAVGMYEQGRREPSLDLVVALAEELRVSTDFLLKGKIQGDSGMNCSVQWCWCPMRASDWSRK